MRLQKIEIHQSTLSMALQSNPISERQSEFRFSPECILAIKIIYAVPRKG